MIWIGLGWLLGSLAGAFYIGWSQPDDPSGHMAVAAIWPVVLVVVVTCAPFYLAVRAGHWYAKRRAGAP